MIESRGARRESDDEWYVLKDERIEKEFIVGCQNREVDRVH